MRPVAIVGAGAISTHGSSWRGLGTVIDDERSPVRALAASHPGTTGYEVAIAKALVPGTRKQQRLMSRPAKLAAIVIQQCLQQAGWEDGREHIGCFVGVGGACGDIAALEAVARVSIRDHQLSMAKLGRDGPRAASPLATFHTLNNFTLCHAAIVHGLGGPNAAIYSRGSGTVDAIREAHAAIASGDCQRAIAAGADCASHPVAWEKLRAEGWLDRGMLVADGAAAVALAPGGDALAAGGDALAAGGDALAWLAGCALTPLAPAGTGLADALRTLQTKLDRQWTAAADRVLIAACDRDEQRWLQEHVRGAVAAPLSLGHALAAAPALLLAAAVDTIGTTLAECVDVITLGPDHQLAGLRIIRAPRSVDVSSVDVSNTDVSNTDVSNTDVSNTDVSNTDVSSADVSSADVSSADVSGADVSSADVSGANVSSADVSSEAVSGADVRSAAVNSEPRRVVVTGLGVVSAFGVGADVFFAGLARGDSAVRPITSFEASASPVAVAAEVPVAATNAAWIRGAGDIDAPQLDVWQREGVLRDRKVAFALLAASEAWRAARCGQAERTAELRLGLGLEQNWPEDYAAVFDDERFDFTLAGSLPRERLRGSGDLGARCVHALLQLQGPWAVNTSACAAGALTVAEAAARIKRGEADIILCGGADSMVNPLAIGGFWALGAPSPRPERNACRPFDVRRDGLVIGEGAALLVLESEERARARGAPILAHVLGWGSSQDAYRATTPRPDGQAAARAMSAALTRAGHPSIGWVNAHGTGTPLNDPAECRAIRSALGQAAEQVPISSLKGAIGHLMAASGAIEIAASVLALNRDLLPGTAHLSELDPDCDLDIIGPQPRAARVDAVMSSSFGFGGQNAVVVLGRAP